MPVGANIKLVKLPGSALGPNFEVPEPERFEPALPESFRLFSDFLAPSDQRVDHSAYRGAKENGPETRPNIHSVPFQSAA